MQTLFQAITGGLFGTPTTLAAFLFPWLILLSAGITLWHALKKKMASEIAEDPIKPLVIPAVSSVLLLYISTLLPVAVGTLGNLITLLMSIASGGLLGVTIGNAFAFVLGKLGIE